ncbi:YtxH domain-containing protein [Paenibacillus pasadenensis]|uniref:YtxH domain-containing protein n=1 Tax=Paenibacillus pasadenensis TaxID=217090 RepID=UPI00203E30E7|nr:YtxH domain-containing protein [Paenibacillus pasadenensis]MCM3748318.1 YtxH domain-containing protein [Paenibacillus pasadenensis]
MANETAVKGGNMAKGILIGGAIGAAAALLFAPKTGKEFRSDIARKSSDAADYAKRQGALLAEQAKSTAAVCSDKASAIGSKVQELAIKAKDAAMIHQEGVKETAATAMAETKEAINEVKDHARQVTSEAGRHMDNIKKEADNNREEAMRTTNSMNGSTYSN